MESTDLPFVSVIMPVRNEAAFIAQSLGAVLAQDYPHDQLEVFIADGMSTDATRVVIAETAARHETISVKVIDNPQQIVPTGMNLALAEAHGEVIIRVDGHTIIAPDYVQQCVMALHRTGADNVGGRMDARSTTPLGEAAALATGSPFGVGGARFHYSHREEYVDTVYMGAWRRSIFANVGLFDEELVRNQDDEFNYRLRGAGGKILLLPNIRSEYFPRTTWKGLWRQYFQYGFYKVRVLQKHPAQMQLRQFVPPVFVSFLVGGAILGLGSRLVRRLWAFMVLSYALVNFIVSWRLAAQHGLRHLRLLPTVFASLHLSYGLGFLAGLVRFANRWRDSGNNAH
ncbi:MAG: glycosyltransferase family 2 protein [Anaerolineae bacterium]|nr:glycosyltransferase family 2 protein [Anaerolineae bacterium]